MRNLNLYGGEYYDYIQLLQSGNQYGILISKRLLLKPVIPMWLYFLGLFLIPNGIFFAMVGLPSLLLFAVFLVAYFPLWSVCNVSTMGYIFFHTVCLALLKIASVPLSFLLEVLWILFF